MNILVKTTDNEIYQVDTDKKMITGGNLENPMEYTNDDVFLLGEENRFHLSDGQELTFTSQLFVSMDGLDYNEAINQMMNTDLLMQGDIPGELSAAAENLQQQAVESTTEDPVPESQEAIQSAKEDLEVLASDAEKASNTIKENADKALPTIEDLLKEVQSLKNQQLNMAMDGRDGKYILKTEMQNIKSGLDTPYADLLVKQTQDFKEGKYDRASIEEKNDIKIKAVAKKYNEYKSQHSKFHLIAIKLDEIVKQARNMIPKVGHSISAAAVQSWIAVKRPFVSLGQSVAEKAVQFGKDAQELQSSAKEYTKQVNNEINSEIESDKTKARELRDKTQECFNRASEGLTNTGKFLAAKYNEIQQDIGLRSKILDTSVIGALKIRQASRDLYINKAENKASTRIKIAELARKVMLEPPMTEVDRQNYRRECYKEYARKINTCELACAECQEVNLKSIRMRLQNQLKTAEALYNSPLRRFKAKDRLESDISNMKTSLEGLNTQIDMIHTYRTDLLNTLNTEPDIMIDNYMASENNRVFDTALSQPDKFGCVYTFNKSDLKDTDFAVKVRQNFPDSVIIGNIRNDKLAVATFDKATSYKLEKLAKSNLAKNNIKFDSNTMREATETAKTSIEKYAKEMDAAIRDEDVR